MSETPVFTDLRRTFEWTCPECGSDHYDVGEVDGQILTCEGCSKTVLVRWPGLSAEGVVAEQPEWEYGAQHSQGTNAHPSRKQAEEMVAWHAAGDDRKQLHARGKTALVRRRKAGPWIPVMNEEKD